MIADGMKLTTYFGERERVADGLLADAMVDLYGRNGIRASILLRGVEGFGLGHHLRSDRLLTLSEDLPVVSVAVDARERIEAALGEVKRLGHRGLLTLERARLVSGEGEEIGALSLPEELAEATKMTAYVGRQERVAGRPAYVALCELLHERGIAGATALLGVDGTANGERRRARFFSRNAEVPMMVVAVGSGARIGSVLPELGTLLSRPLLTLERIRVCKRDGELLEKPHALPGTDEHGREIWQKLMICTSEAAKHEGRPIHSELVRRLRASGAAGATSLRGVWGYHGAHRPHGDRLLQLRRHVPVVTTVIDTPDRITASFEIVDELTATSGLVTSEMVPAMTTFAGDERGLRLARRRF